MGSFCAKMDRLGLSIFKELMLQKEVRGCEFVIGWGRLDVGFGVKETDIHGRELSVGSLDC
jgi:hypothetical protein